MAKTKGYKCSSCDELKADLTEHGHFKCRECGAIYWTIFDRPVAGGKGQGERCSECGNTTLHLIAKMDEVQVLRCSACAFTLLKHAQES